MKAKGIIKISKGGLTISTRRLRSYPGDNSVQIMLTTERGVIVPMFNIWPATYKGMRWWRGDRYGAGPFQTITRWKQWALDRALKERAQQRRK